MSVSLTDHGIELAGACGVEEAETLLALLQGHPAFAVDVSQAGNVHTALWQVIIALRPQLVGEPKNPFVREWILPNLAVPSG